MRRIFILLLMMILKESSGTTDRSLSDLISTTESSDGSLEEMFDPENVSSNSSLEYNWECSSDPLIREKQLVKTIAMLKEGEKSVSSLLHSALIYDTVLVLGDAGVGKTTFVQFMAGNNSRLISKEIGLDSGHYVIDDQNKIGSSVIDSNTLYPEKLSYSSSMDIYDITDTPGFSDTRSPMHEVVATYVMKKYISKLENVKIVLLVNYNSLKYGNNKREFMNFLKNLHSFTKDLDRFKDNVVLIATKVRKEVRETKTGFEMVSDKNIIHNIVEFLFKVKVSLEKKIKTSGDEKEKIFLQKAINLITVLMETDENGKYKKVNLFHRPTKAGILQDMADMQEGKKSINETVFGSTGFTKITGDDIGYTLTDRSKNYLFCLLNHISENVKQLSLKIFQNIHRHFQEKFRKFNNIYILSDKLDGVLKDLESLKDELDGAGQYNKYIENLKQYNRNHGIAIGKSLNDTLSHVSVYLNELNGFINSELVLIPSVWSSSMKPLMDYVREEKAWYRFLVQFSDVMSSFSVQNSKNMYLKIFGNTYDPLVVKSNLLKVIVQENAVIDESAARYITGLSLEKEKLNELESIISFSLNTSIDVTCSSEGKLTVKGNFVKVSDFINSDNCGNITLKSVIIFATKTFFIDEDIVSDVYKGIDIMISAPIWEIIGHRKIGIDGRGCIKRQLPNNGYIHESPSTMEFMDPWGFREKRSIDDGHRGKDGLPGLPGENGGNFVGFGLKFINGAGLTVSANGGKGGDGIDGEVGGRGEKGLDGFDLLDESYYSRTDNFNETFYGGFKSLSRAKFYTSRKIVFRPPSKRYSYTHRWTNGYDYIENEISSDDFHYFELAALAVKLDVVTLDGFPGKSGGDGGDGGIGGLGGNKGSVVLYDSTGMSGITIDCKSGERGLPGSGGRGGKTGAHGSSIVCYHISLDRQHNGDFSEYWRCKNITSISDIEDISVAGRSGHSEKGLSRPTESKSFDYSNDLIDYITLSEQNKDNKLISHLLSEFVNSVLKKQAAHLKSVIAWKLLYEHYLNVTSASMDASPSL